MDLPFSLSRFCAVENIKNVELLSGFRSSFGKDYGVMINTPPLEGGLFARLIVIIDEKGKVTYKQVMKNTIEKPNYEEALASLK